MKSINLFKIWLLLSVLWLTAGCCSYIDDDLSDCPPEGQEYELTYELRLVTNITTELSTQLSTATDVNVANALRDHLKNIFTDFAHDVDLSFYDTENAQERLSHDQHVMNASEQSYTLYLPMREYMHLAAANIQDNTVVELSGDDKCPTAQLATIPEGEETIDSHTTGLFTARYPLKVLEGVSQTFHVRLYMANCAEALVVDPRGHSYRDMKVFATGFASKFHINDSTYTFPEKYPYVRATKVNTGENEKLCFCAVNFPTTDEEGMRTVVEVPFDENESETVFWQFYVYVTNDDGSVTESVLSVRSPNKAGQLRIIGGYMGDDGAIHPKDQTVGVSVTLNWNDGGHHDIDL